MTGADLTKAEWSLGKNPPNRTPRRTTGERRGPKPKRRPMKSNKLGNVRTNIDVPIHWARLRVSRLDDRLGEQAPIDLIRISIGAAADPQLLSSLRVVESRKDASFQRQIIHQRTVHKV
jgi:hypothetical protein